MQNLINHENNAEMLKTCVPWAGYSRFVCEAENTRKNMELGAAIRKAIETS